MPHRSRSNAETDAEPFGTWHFVSPPHLPLNGKKKLPACKKNYLRHILKYLWDNSKYVWDNFPECFQRFFKAAWQKCQVYQRMSVSVTQIISPATSSHACVGKEKSRPFFCPTRATVSNTYYNLTICLRVCFRYIHFSDKALSNPWQTEWHCSKARSCT